MKIIKSDTEILAYKILSQNIDSSWIKWAVDKLYAGFDTEHLRIMAGEFEPFDQSYMQWLTTKVFNELNLNFSDPDHVIKNYVTYLIDNVLIGNFETLSTLRILYNLDDEIYDCLGPSNFELQDFSRLYFAKSDLLVSEMQWYCEGANRENIDSIITETLICWKNKHGIIAV